MGGVSFLAHQTSLRHASGSMDMEQHLSDIPEESRQLGR